MHQSAAEWILIGYNCFAREGMFGLKVESMAREVGLSKSSFYHHFAEMPIFLQQLLDWHLNQCLIIAAKEQTASSIDPELIDILVVHKTDLLFNRQLRIHANHTAFASTLERASKLLGDGFLQLWQKTLPTAIEKQQLNAIYSLALENFYLQMNPENLHADWLRQYFKQLQVTVRVLS